MPATSCSSGCAREQTTCLVALDGLRNILVDDIRLAVTVDAHKNVLVRIRESFQIVMVSSDANFDLKME